jgi:uncharacterized protein (DUF1800 family)
MSALLAGAARKRNPAMTEGEAARFLRQATMGIRTYAEVQALAGTRGQEAWINTQLAYGSAHITDTKPDTTPFVESIANMTGGNGGWNGTAKRTTAWSSFQPGLRLAVNYRMLYHPDRLRCKVVRCLLEYFSVGETADGQYSNAGSVWYDTLTECAFGTFQNLLKRVTMNAEMGSWLTFRSNRKAGTGYSPDENYGREIMQLFTIGLWELFPNGTRKTRKDMVGDSRYIAAGLTGANDEVPTYTIPDIREMARVFTGLDAVGNSTYGTMDFVQSYYISSTARNAANATTDHDFGAKSALYGWIDIRTSGTASNTTFIQSGAATAAEAERELDYVLKRLTEHPCTAPFFCKNMIQMLVTSNPSNEYVARVASVFQNDGTGQVGNLAAVWKAILLDQDARAPADRAKISRVSHFYDIGNTLAQLHPAVTDTNGNKLAIATGNDSKFKIVFSGDINDGLGGDQRYGMRSMRSVFRRIPVRFSPVGPLATAGLSSPESFLLDEYGATLLYSIPNLYGGLVTPYELAVSQTADYGTLTTTANIPALITKWSILLTGDTAPAQFKTDLNTLLAANYPITNDAQRISLMTAMIEALLVGPYGMVRT